VRELLDRLVEQMVEGGIAFEDGRREFERRFIGRVLAQTGGRLSEAAARLGIHRNTLARKLAELDVAGVRRRTRTRSRPRPR
jgi:DNA-binding NtrC family response regulator